MLSLLWLRRRALLGAVAGVIAVVVFAAFASVGLPINTRYAFLAAAILCIFCGAGVFGWTQLPERGDRAAALVDGAAARSWRVALVAYAPATVPNRPTGNSANWRAEHGIEDELVALVDHHAINARVRPGRGAQPRARSRCWRCT